jgi:hypothetical protein
MYLFYLIGYKYISTLKSVTSLDDTLFVSRASGEYSLNVDRAV